MRWMLALALSSAWALAGCDHDPIDSDLSQECNAPTQNLSTLPTTALAVYPNAMDTTITGPEPGFAILADGLGGWRVEWTNPDGDAVCFTGLVTVTESALGSTISPDDANETVQFTNPQQIAFAAIQSTAVEGFNFTAGTQQVDLEVYVDGAAGTYIYYTDDSTGLSTSVENNVSGFVSP